MVRYFLHKLLVFALSMLIALSLMVLSFSFLAIGLFHSSSYVDSGLRKNGETIISAVDEKLEVTAEELSLPSEMLTGAINKNNIGIITEEVSHNFIYGYSTSFANSTELYSAFITTINDYNSKNNKKMSDGEVSRIAALAVDSVNEAVGSTDTSGLTIFAFVRSRLMIIVLIVFALILIGSIVALVFLNNGRHRKFNYIGMGLTTGGVVSSASAAYIIYKGYLESYRFCAFDAYDSAVKYCVSVQLKIFLFTGIILFVIGLVMLFNNYRYFKIRKDAFIERHKTDGDDKMGDYMDNYYTKNMRTHIPGEEFEKDVKKIDFEDD